MYKIKIKAVIAGSLLLGLTACNQPGPNDPGSEYMPDMGHSIAYEANHYDYYYYNTWGGEDAYHEMAQPRKPVAGTVPRADAGNKALEASMNGLASDYGRALPSVESVPYRYADTEEARTAAIAEIIDNPYKITDDGIAKGKELYEIFCATCHGEKGDGAGYLVRDDGGVYPAQPANFLLEEHLNASNGRYYHAIMHGKNLMGGYADKINYEERWQVIHYIRSLQAKELKKTYNQFENTLNAVDIPAGEIAVVEEMPTEVHDDHHDGYGHDHDHHGDDHDHHGEDHDSH